jgi:hypothetical protein
MRSRQRPSLAALGLLLAVLGLAGCGSETGPKVATANGGAGDGGVKPSASVAPVDRQEALMKFAQCMRDNGVNMPDPEVQPGGGVLVRPGQGTNINPNDAKFQAAMEKCRSLLPNGGVPPTLSPEELEQQQKFAACMREHGVDFPDPDPATGRVRIAASARAIDPDSQTFRDALAACQHLRPTFGNRQ